eukprot:CAMPEP_0172477868 /NCGR_PEP_ID=MMETSP1066-20121228/1402_1 /TAXON_ID=671091 /ORGANISM="Coscinodiscus wailesii, Strain CCMP2513" /LENGTH=146 /DNA_ID=CAMNT_0013236857 /DNA_START=218 /DNA_END=658 /DNA_ORIENTATION=-
MTLPHRRELLVTPSLRLYTSLYRTSSSTQQNISLKSQPNILGSHTPNKFTPSSDLPNHASKAQCTASAEVPPHDGKTNISGTLTLDSDDEHACCKRTAKFCIKPNGMLSREFRQELASKSQPVLNTKTNEKEEEAQRPEICQSKEK